MVLHPIYIFNVISESLKAFIKEIKLNCLKSWSMVLNISKGYIFSTSDQL